MSKNKQVSKASKFRFKFWWVKRPAQVAAFILFFGGLWHLGPWPLVVPALNCLGVEEKTFGCAFGVLQDLLYRTVMLWMVPAVFLVGGVILGRTFCGWFCPFGFVMDLLSFIKRKRTEFSLRTHNLLKDVKYGVLFSILLVSGALATSLILDPVAGEEYKMALGVFGEAPFCVLCPAGTLFAVIPTFVVKTLPTLPPVSMMSWELLTTIATPLLVTRIVLLAIFLLAGYYVTRFWCRYFCPVGALMALISRVSYLGLGRNLTKCTKCRLCVEKCPMAVRILDLPWEKFTDPECTLCMECYDVCPEDALSLQAP